jgi:hypothetical protein
VPNIKLISFPLNSSFRANPVQTHGVEILTGLTWEFGMERCLQALSQFRSRTTLFPFCHFRFHLSAEREPVSRLAKGNAYHISYGKVVGVADNKSKHVLTPESSMDGGETDWR